MSEAGSKEPRLDPQQDNDADPDQGHRSHDKVNSKSLSAEVIHISMKSMAPQAKPAASQVVTAPITFNQAELRLIFGLYGHKVAAGEWRDYALDFFPDQAVFSIYRRSSEVPLYRIEKTPRLARKQGEYTAVAASGLILKRGSDLARVLAVLDKPLKIVR